MELGDDAVNRKRVALTAPKAQRRRLADDRVEIELRVVRREPHGEAVGPRDLFDAAEVDDRECVGRHGLRFE